MLVPEPEVAMKRPDGDSSSKWALILCTALILVSTDAGAEPESASPFNNLGTFARALAHVESSYVEEIDQDTLIYGAIRGMLATLDPHSTFMDPEEFRVLASDTEGRYGGIGVEIDVKDGWLTVLNAFEGGPAERAGIRSGDRFLSIEGTPARDIRIDAAIRLMRGEPGTRVRVALRRASEPDAVRLTLTREIIRIQAVEARVLRDRTVYLRVRTFNETTVPDFRRALDEAADRTARGGGIRGLLIDFRNNAGGLLDSAVLLADEFIESGPIVSIHGRGNRKLRQINATSSGTRPAWPMVVLVNGYTASAAEIAAGALSEHKRAVIVGTRTFGKGSVQNIIVLPDGSALKLTTARYYTPSGRSIQARGIEPAVTVEQLQGDASRPSDSDPAAVREATLAGHLRGEGESGPATGGSANRGFRKERQAVAAAEPFPGDYQARVALQILQALVEKNR
jgi:carboxyl-terminal processing protease